MKAKGGHAASPPSSGWRTLKPIFFRPLGIGLLDRQRSLLAMLKKVAAAGSVYTAGRLRKYVGRCFALPLRPTGPLTTPQRICAGRSKHRSNHRPALTTRREFGEFVRDLRDYEKCHPLTKQAARFAMLTWTRPKELRTARWEHFDIEAKEWRVPAVNMKVGKHLQAHTVPLSAQALEVLEAIRELSGDVPVLFPGVHGADRIMSENTINLLFKKMGYAGRQSHHGLRASARSLLSERGWTAAALEAQLDDAERSKVISAYARSEHLVERRKFMEDWGSLVACLEAGENVVPISRAA